MPRKSGGKTGVFWDPDACPVPGGVDPNSIGERIKSAVALKSCSGKVSTRAYAAQRRDRSIIIPGGDSLCFAGTRIVDEGRLDNFPLFNPSLIYIDIYLMLRTMISSLYSIRFDSG